MITVRRNYKTSNADKHNDGTLLYATGEGRDALRAGHWNITQHDNNTLKYYYYYYYYYY